MKKKHINSLIVNFLIIMICCPSTWAGSKIFSKSKDGVLYFTDTPSEEGFKPFHDPRASAYFSESSDRAQYSTFYPPDTYNDIIEEAAVKHNLSISLIKAMIKVESGFNPNAVSRVGAKGLMQVMPKTIEELNIMDPFNPYENIMGGTRYMRGLLTRFGGQLEKALAAYNAGASAVEKYNGIPPYDETRCYVDRVIKYYRSNSNN